MFRSRASTASPELWALRRKNAWVYAALFVFSLACFTTLAGDRLRRPSSNNHFAHLAAAWLDGRLDQGGPPPGYCTRAKRAAGECKHHRYDDWARVTELELHTGETLFVYRCKARACREKPRVAGHELWWQPGHGPRNVARDQISRRSERWYVSFPPGPALLFLPGVALIGPAVNDVWLTCLLAAFSACVALSLAMCATSSTREPEDVARRLADQPFLLWALLALVFASPFCLLGAHGRVWFTGQMAGFAALALALRLAWHGRYPVWAGLMFALAFASRTPMLFALPAFVGLAWRSDATLRTISKFFALPLAAGIALLVLNEVRFGNPFEFGHRFLDIRWQSRIQDSGLFSLQYLPRNLECLAWLMPQLSTTAPFVRLSTHGCALWSSSPWLLWCWRTRRTTCPAQIGFLLSTIAVAIPGLLYQNSGQVQPVYRFAGDWLIFPWLSLLVVGPPVKPWLRRALYMAVILAVAFQVWSTWQFGHAPGRLFVTDPMGWPFSNERH